MLLREVRHVLFGGLAEWLICSVRVQSLGISAGRFRKGNNGTCAISYRASYLRLLCRHSTARPSRRLRSAKASHLVRRPTTGQEYASISSLPSTRAAAGRVPFQSRRSVRLPTDICTCVPNLHATGSPNDSPGNDSNSDSAAIPPARRGFAAMPATKGGTTSGSTRSARSATSAGSAVAKGARSSGSWCSANSSAARLRHPRVIQRHVDDRLPLDFRLLQRGARRRVQHPQLGFQRLQRARQRWRSGAARPRGRLRAVW